jgi:hypothetical protein
VRAPARQGRGGRAADGLAGRAHGGVRRPGRAAVRCRHVAPDHLGQAGAEAVSGPPAAASGQQRDGAAPLHPRPGALLRSRRAAGVLTAPLLTTHTTAPPPPPAPTPSAHTAHTAHAPAPRCRWRATPPEEARGLCYLQGARVLPGEPQGGGGGEAPPPGPTCPHSGAVIVCHFLAFLRAFILEELSERCGAGSLQSLAIQYCIAVPAGMRRATQQLVVECAAAPCPCSAALAALALALHLGVGGDQGPTLPCHRRLSSAVPAAGAPCWRALTSGAPPSLGRPRRWLPPP